MAEIDLMDLHTQLMNAVEAIDEKLDSQTDSSAAGKRKLTNDFIEKNEGTWKPIADSLITQLADVPEDAQIGFYYGLVRALNNAFGTKLSASLDAIVEAQPKIEIVVIPEDELEVLTKTRSELYGKVKSLIEMAKNFGMSDGMTMPKKRTGKQGKRGPRAISFFSFDVDGKPFDTLKEVQEEYAGNYEKVAALTKAIRESGINLTDPGERFEFTMPDGKILIGVKDEDKVSAPESVTADSEDDDDDDSDSETE